MLEDNRPLPVFLKPLFQCKDMTCEAIDIKISFYSHFQKEGFAPENSEMAYSLFSVKTEKHSLPLSSSLFIIFQLPFFIIITFRPYFFFCGKRLRLKHKKLTFQYLKECAAQNQRIKSGNFL